MKKLLKLLEMCVKGELESNSHLYREGNSLGQS